MIKAIGVKLTSRNSSCCSYFDTRSWSKGTIIKKCPGVDNMYKVKLSLKLLVVASKATHYTANRLISIKKKKILANLK